MRRDKSVVSPLLCETRFVATIEMVEAVPKVVWAPDLGVDRVYRVLGAKGLGDAAFGCSALPRQISGTGLSCLGEVRSGVFW